MTGNRAQSSISRLMMPVPIAAHLPYFQWCHRETNPFFFFLQQILDWILISFHNTGSTEIIDLGVPWFYSENNIFYWKSSSHHWLKWSLNHSPTHLKDKCKLVILYTQCISERLYSLPEYIQGFQNQSDQSSDLLLVIN